MDPASAIIGIMSGAAGLVALSIQTGTFLTNVYDTYKNVQLVLWDLRTTCQAFQMAWTNVQTWVQAKQGDPGSISPVALEQLNSYVGCSKIVLDLLRADMDRLFPGWKSQRRLMAIQRSARISAKVIQHQPIIRDHCERIGRQTSALILILSTIQLPSTPVQEAVLEIFRPIFRKDEETAWTIVQTLPSKTPSISPPTSSRASRLTSRHSSTLVASKSNLDFVEDLRSLTHRRYSFEDELITSPVYKRLLYAKLRETPFRRPTSKSGWEGEYHGPSTEEFRSCLPEDDTGKSIKTTCQNDSSDTIEGILSDVSSILRDAGSFSLSSVGDLEKLRIARQRSETLLPRHLPLANNLQRREMDQAEQLALDQRFLSAVKNGDAEDMALSLDAGADINARYREGSETSMQCSISLCFQYFRARLAQGLSYCLDIIDLLFLYWETQLGNFTDESGTILHACMEFGVVSFLQRVPVNVETLNIQDRSGNSPLHHAVLAGDRGLRCLQKLSDVSAGKMLKLDVILDQQGRSPLQLAVDKGMDSHALHLITIGFSPAALVFDKPANSKDQPSQLAQTIYIAGRGPEFRAGTLVPQPLDILLYWAAVKDRPKVIQTLLEHGATWNKVLLNRDRVYHQVRSPETVLRLLARSSLPQKAMIDLSCFIYGLIWRCDKRLINDARYGDAKYIWHDCYNRVQSGDPVFFIYTKKLDSELQRHSKRNRSRMCCIHVVLEAVIKILEKLPPDSEKQGWTRDMALEEYLDSYLEVQHKKKVAEKKKNDRLRAQEKEEQDLLKVKKKEDKHRERLPLALQAAPEKAGVVEARNWLVSYRDAQNDPIWRYI